MRTVALTAALGVLCLPGAALAQVANPVAADLLECPAQGVTPAFRDKLADAMLAEDQGDDALFEHLMSVADDCAGRFGLAADKGEAYFTYTLSRLPRDALIVRLGAAGISAQVIDDALDFGEGRRNPVISGDLSETQVVALLAALKAQGVDVETVPEGSWAMIGAYAAASSLMWQSRRKLQ